MSEDLFRRIRTDLLYPPFLAKAKAVLEELEGRGHRFYATTGDRGFAEQDALFAIGRTTGTPGHHVTNARGGQSLHQFRIALDSCHDSDINKPGLQPDYKTKPEYQLLADTARAHGLEAGFYWVTIPDGPHIQLPYKSRGIGLRQLNEAYASGGYDGLYRFLDRFKW